MRSWREGLRIEGLKARSRAPRDIAVRRGASSSGLQPSSPSGLRRGLTLLELTLALTISALVAAAIAGMLGAVSTGVGTRKDNRTLMVLANNAQSRLAAYIAPAQCVLANDGETVVLWFDDSRKSGTVHATEIRWLLFDVAAGTLSVWYVDFPDEWMQAACDMNDDEYLATEDWDAVLTAYQNKGWISSIVLVDRLASVLVTTDDPTATQGRHIMFELGFQSTGSVVPNTVASTIRAHQAPVN